LVIRGSKIDHIAGEHDDHANAIAGAVYGATARKRELRVGTFNAYAGGGKVTWKHEHEKRPRLRFVTISEREAEEQGMRFK
jgi:hypothetical protein